MMAVLMAHSASGQGEMYAHWLLVESENDPVNDPVVVWYQGKTAQPPPSHTIV